MISLLQYNRENKGSGSLEKDSPVYIIAVEKEEQTHLVHRY